MVSFMYTLLTLETSSRFCSVALYRKGECLGENSEITSYQKNAAALLAPQVDELLRAHHLSPGALTHIGINRGPGSFTGLRIGLAFAQGLAFPKGLPVMTSTSFAIIQNKYRNKARYPLLILLDTKCRSYYSAWYEKEGEDPQTDVLGKEDISRYIEKAAYIIMDKDDEEIGKKGEEKIVLMTPLTAQDVGQYFLALPQFPKVSPLEPYYLKEPNITGTPCI